MINAVETDYDIYIDYKCCWEQGVTAEWGHCVGYIYSYDYYPTAS